MTNSATPTTRLRWPKWLDRPAPGEAPWANLRPELRNLEIAEHVLLVRQSKHWQDVIVPACQAIDAERSRRGAKFLYTSEELETILVFGVAAGCTTYKETRNLLAGDRKTARRLLGFDRPRNPPRRAKLMKLHDGIPSEATMSRHKTRFDEEQRAELHAELERRMRREHLETADLQDELGVLYLDGTTLLTHYTAPIRSKKCADVMNTRKVTCPDGGFMPPSAGPDKSGHGWNLVTIATSSQVPLDWTLVPLNASEKETGLELIREQFAANTAPFLGERIAALTADGGFHKAELRAELHRHGVIENLHVTSHSRGSAARAERLTNERFPIEGYPNWQANGHREIFCRCGRRPAKVVERRKDGGVSVRVEGKCPKCGPFAATAGDWYYTQDNKFARTKGHEPVSARDWAFGNGLSFNDPVSYELGVPRFVRHEGLHGVLETRFRLIRHKRWFRRLNQAKIETAMCFTLLHALALEQRRRARLARSGAPPGQPLAA